MTLLISHWLFARDILISNAVESHPIAMVQVQEDPILVLLLGIIVVLLIVLIGIMVWGLRSPTAMAQPASRAAPIAAASRSRGGPGSRRTVASPDRAGFVRSAIQDTPTPHPFARPYVTAPTRTPPIVERVPHAALLIDRRDPGRRFDVWPVVNLGRSTDNTLQVLDMLVSRRHACLRLEQQRYCLFDLGSANGTFVNNQRVNGARFLSDGDVLAFGETEFMFRQLA